MKPSKKQLDQLDQALDTAKKCVEFIRQDLETENDEHLHMSRAKLEQAVSVIDRLTEEITEEFDL